MTFREHLALLYAPRNAEGCSGWCSKCPPNESIITTTIFCFFIAERQRH